MKVEKEKRGGYKRNEVEGVREKKKEGNNEKGERRLERGEDNKRDLKKEGKLEER